MCLMLILYLTFKDKFIKLIFIISYTKIILNVYIFISLCKKCYHYKFNKHDTFFYLEIFL